MSTQKYKRIPPKFSELKKEADKIEDKAERLNFWLKQKKDYVQERSWKMKKVDVIDSNDFYPSETLKRRQKNSEITGEDHNLRSIKAEIEHLKEKVSSRIAGDKIDLWIGKNIPNSPNKDTYKEVFSIISQHPNPKDCTTTDLLEIVHQQYTPDLSDESLRKKIPHFVRDMPL